jgi:hypothetical protein
MSNELDPVALAGGSNPNITTLHPLKRFAKGSNLLQSAHVSTLRPPLLSTLRPSGFASQHFSYLFGRRGLSRLPAGINHFENWCKWAMFL